MLRRRHSSGHPRPSQKRKEHVRAFKRVHHAKLKRAGSIASDVWCQRTADVTAAIDNGDNTTTTTFDQSFLDKIDWSHDNACVHPDSDAFFCRRCGAWNAGGPLCKLTKPCKGSIDKTGKKWLRALTAGIVPQPGVKISASSKHCL